MDSLKSILTKYRLPDKSTPPKKMAQASLFEFSSPPAPFLTTPLSHSPSLPPFSRQPSKKNFYYDAKLFADKFKISIPLVLKLFKIYGRRKVLDLASFLVDCPLRPHSTHTKVLIWRLRHLYPQKKW